MNEADDARSSAVCAALRSHSWRSLPPEEVVRVLLAARDRHRVEVLVNEAGGTVAGDWHDLSPVDPDDLRVAPLTELLAVRPWRELSLTALAAELLDTLDRWWFRWQWRLGDEPAPAPGDDA
jgi:hypothetical protein